MHTHVHDTRALNTDVSINACMNTHKHTHYDLRILSYECIINIYVDAAENSHELLSGEEEGADYDVGVSSSNISVSTPESLRFSSTYCFTPLHSALLRSAVPYFTALHFAPLLTD